MTRSIAILLLTAAFIPHAALADTAALDIAAPFEIRAADPVLSGDIFLKMDVMETLVNADASGALVPGLSEGWTVSDDKLVWRFHIRQGVQFHDGSALTAEAAANALNWSKTKEGVLVKAPIALISAEGENVVITLSEPFAALPAFLAEYRTGILAPSAYATDGSVTAVIGTGAFKVTKLEPPMTLEAERFDAYWGGAASIPAVHYTSVTRAETRALMAEAGDAELVVNLDPASVTRLQSVDNVTVQSVSMPRVLILKVNNALPFFDTVEERQALSLAIDRAGLAQAVLRYPAAASQMLPPAMGGWHNAALPPLDYDAEGAKAAFAAAGWVQGANGILEKDGQRFEVELLTYPDRPELPLTAAVLESCSARWALLSRSMRPIRRESRPDTRLARCRWRCSRATSAWCLIRWAPSCRTTRRTATGARWAGKTRISPPPCANWRPRVGPTPKNLPLRRRYTPNCRSCPLPGISRPPPSRTASRVSSSIRTSVPLG
ncbi:MAG: ABC transporter substrate-binding protein [Cypionkella sp.]|uniref:ABC transporter substrate-binding protein n=1 Tax=Cypionkella sp. TaxID=2811411 RepID=UPI002ABB4084|nr:ABC transporter substrate-binding protein [Cypionkella sp.]MDZ4312122.1 ABC transporter substrate-binding protein [Cypionkella sp.]